MSETQHINKMHDLAKQIVSKIQWIERLEESRKTYEVYTNRHVTVHIAAHFQIFNDDGTPRAAFDGLRNEYIKVHNSMIQTAKSELEGLRYRMVQLGKTP